MCQYPRASQWSGNRYMRSRTYRPIATYRVPLKSAVLTV